MSSRRRAYASSSPEAFTRAYFGLRTYPDPDEAHVWDDQSAMERWFWDAVAPRPELPQHRVLCAGPRKGGKSTWGALGVPAHRAVWNLRSRYGLMVGATMAPSKENLFTIRQEFENNRHILEDYGDLADHRHWGATSIRIFKPQDMHKPVHHRRHTTIRCATHKTAAKSVKLGSFRPDFVIGDDAESQKEGEVITLDERKAFRLWFWGKLVLSLAPEHHFILWLLNHESDDSVGGQILAGRPFLDDELEPYGKVDASRPELVEKHRDWICGKFQAIIDEFGPNERSYDPVRFPLEVLQAIRAESPASVWCSQMQQDPKDPSSAIFTSHDIGIQYAYGPAPRSFAEASTIWPGLTTSGSCDRAVSKEPGADYTALVTLGRTLSPTKIPVIDYAEGRWDLEELYEEVRIAHSVWGWRVLYFEVEGTFLDTYRALVSWLRMSNINLKVKAIRHAIRNKGARMESIQPWLRDRTVQLATDHDLMRTRAQEVRAVGPSGKKDVIDALAMGVIEEMEVKIGIGGRLQAASKMSAQARLDQRHAVMGKRRQVGSIWQ